MLGWAFRLFAFVGHLNFISRRASGFLELAFVIPLGHGSESTLWLQGGPSVGPWSRGYPHPFTFFDFSHVHRHVMASKAQGQVGGGERGGRETWWPMASHRFQHHYHHTRGEHIKRHGVSWAAVTREIRRSLGKGLGVAVTTRVGGERGGGGGGSCLLVVQTNTQKRARLRRHSTHFRPIFLSVTEFASIYAGRRRVRRRNSSLPASLKSKLAGSYGRHRPAGLSTWNCGKYTGTTPALGHHCVRRSTTGKRGNRFGQRRAGRHWRLLSTHTPRLNGWHRCGSSLHTG